MEKKRREVDSLRTASHIKHFWNHPLRNITIELWCTIKRCFNHLITKIQKEKNKIKKREKENWKNVSVFKFIIMKSKTRKSNTLEKNWNWLLHTFFHVENTWNHPPRNITIKLWCTIKRCFNHSITRIQEQKKKH